MASSYYQKTECLFLGDSPAVLLSALLAKLQSRREICVAPDAFRCEDPLQQTYTDWFRNHRLHGLADVEGCPGFVRSLFLASGYRLECLRDVSIWGEAAVAGPGVRVHLGALEVLHADLTRDSGSSALQQLDLTRLIRLTSEWMNQCVMHAWEQEKLAPKERWFDFFRPSIGAAWPSLLDMKLKALPGYGHALKRALDQLPVHHMGLLFAAIQNETIRHPRLKDWLHVMSLHYGSVAIEGGYCRLRQILLETISTLGVTVLPGLRVKPPKSGATFWESAEGALKAVKTFVGAAPRLHRLPVRVRLGLRVTLKRGCHLGAIPKCIYWTQAEAPILICQRREKEGVEEWFVHADVPLRDVAPLIAKRSQVNAALDDFSLRRIAKAMLRALSDICPFFPELMDSVTPDPFLEDIPFFPFETVDAVPDALKTFQSTRSTQGGDCYLSESEPHLFGSLGCMLQAQKALLSLNKQDRPLAET